MGHFAAASEAVCKAMLLGGVTHRFPKLKFGKCGFSTGDDLVRQFVDGSYFGCEADDPINAWPFKRDFLALGVQLKTLFGSDIGHFDVQDMSDVLNEAYELVDDGLIDEHDFRQFSFENAARFLAEANPNFFKGTALEAAVNELLAVQ